MKPIIKRKITAISLILYILLMILFILFSNKCFSQTIYTSIIIDPLILSKGIRIDATKNKNCISIAYCTGNPIISNYTGIVQKSKFTQVQLGYGKELKQDPSKEGKFILTGVLSYNFIESKQPKFGCGFGVLVELRKRLCANCNTDLITWTTNLGIGIKLNINNH